MAKKSKKVEKETRRLMESIGDIIKKKGDRYKFKGHSKKAIKKVKKTCVHWIMKNGREKPTVIHDPDRPGYWKCQICGKSFPISPAESNIPGKNAYQIEAEYMLEFVNQMQFYGVKLGGNAEDTKMFLKLKELLPRFAKVSKQILKRIKQREKFESNKEQTDAMSQFAVYKGFNWR